MAKKQPVDDWVDVESSDSNEWEDVDDTPAASFGNVKSGKSSSQPSSSFMDSVSSGWETANKSLFDYGPDWLNPSKRVSERIAAEPGASPEDWDIPFTGGAKWKGLRQGIEQGAADTVSGLASPLNIATGLATGGSGSAIKAGMPSVGRGLGLTGKALSAPVAVHGGMEMIRPDATMQERIMGGVELAGGAAGTMARIPVKKPGLKSITPEVEASLGQITTQRLLELEQQANQTIKNTPNEVAKRQAEGVPPGAPKKEPSVLDTLQEPKKARPSQSERAISRIEDQIPPEMRESFGAVDEAGSPNASGDSAASVEALSRQEGMRSRGETFVVYDKAGVARNLTGPEAVDYQPRPGETYGIKTPRGFVQLNNNGGNVPASTKTIKPRTGKEYPGFKGQAGEPVGDATGLRGRLDTATKQSSFSGPLDERGINEELARLRQPKAETGIVPEEGVTAAPDVLDPEAQALRDQTQSLPKPDDMGIANEMSEGRRQIATQGNEPPIPPKKRTPEEFGPEDFEKEIKPLSDTLEDVADLPDGPEKEGIIRKTNNAMRSLLTTWDFSAPGRQGKAFLFNKAYWTSLDDMVKAWHSEGAAQMINESITNHPSGYFKRKLDSKGKPMPSFAERSGLDMSTSEEVFKGTLGDKFKKYSGINKAGRAHTAFLNKLRSDQFAAFMEDSKKAGRDGEANPLVAKQFADFINNATGRGSLNIKKWKLERNAGALSDVFFAPKNMSGQIRTWNQVLNPYQYYQADPIIRKQALKSLFAIAGTGMAVGELAKMAGGEVSNDPTSTDFRKIKLGDTRIDLFGGYQQFPVAAMRLLLGKTTNPAGKTNDLQSGKFGMPTRASVAERFFTNRLGPLPAFVWSWMSNREFDGKPFEMKKALYERALPIAVSDMWELAQEDPKLALILSPLLITGMAGTQTYTRE